MFWPNWSFVKLIPGDLFWACLWNVDQELSSLGQHTLCGTFGIPFALVLVQELSPRHRMHEMLNMPHSGEQFSAQVFFFWLREDLQQASKPTLMGENLWPGQSECDFSLGHAFWGQPAVTGQFCTACSMQCLFLLSTNTWILKVLPIPSCSV